MKTIIMTEQDMLLKGMKGFLVHFLLGLTAVQCEWNVTYSSTHVCGLKGVSVVLPCTYQYSYEGAYLGGEWYEEKSGRVIQHSHSTYPDCSLNIDNLSDGDSGVYQFRFYTVLHLKWITSERGITLSVTDLRVEEVVAQKQHQTEVTCSTSCSLHPDLQYVWYKTGQILQDRTTASILVYEVASYSCAVRGHEALRSPAVCVPDKQCWGVTYSDENICVLMGSSVDILCTYLHPRDDRISNMFWYHNQKSIMYGYLGKKENSFTLRLEDIRQSHSGEYTFRLTTTGGQGFSGVPGVTISVTDLQVWATLDTVKEGDKVTLTCNTTCTLSNNPNFIWYKNGQPVTYKHTTRDNKLHLDPVSSEDAGSYSCAVKGDESLSSAAVSLNVRYKPKNVLASITASSTIEEGSVVTLTCSSDANPPVHTYTWSMKSGAESLVMGTGESVSFNLTSNTSGLYYCEAQNELGSQISTEVVFQTDADVLLPAIVTTFIILAVLLILGIGHLRKKNVESITRATNVNTQSDSGPMYSTITARATASDPTQRATSCDQDDIKYASVRINLSKTQEVPLNSTVNMVPTSTLDNNIVYTSVQLLTGSAATRADDKGEIYSAVHKS
ncbi:B-cell receptor CD22-like isoform X2 [Alosa pseudoharengus]|uniref:B-cell receptor CD22-like isoform X2 n=1 Tax=Alosa pseudoharengus TaxID=34774 RepID=UPI003F89720D